MTNKQFDGRDGNKSIDLRIINTQLVLCFLIVSDLYFTIFIILNLGYILILGLYVSFFWCCVLQLKIFGIMYYEMENIEKKVKG